MVWAAWAKGGGACGGGRGGGGGGGGCPGFPCAVRGPPRFAFHAMSHHSRAWISPPQDVSDCLHGQATASSTLLLAVIELGMAECCTRLATRQALKIANQSGQLLLGTAVKSNSLEMVETVRTHPVFEHHICTLNSSCDAYGCMC